MTPYERLNEAIREGRLVRKHWRLGEKTHLLVALSPEAEGNPGACPLELMPQWMAHLTSWINDAGTEERWHEVVRRYADLAPKWVSLSDEQWERIRTEWIADDVLVASLEIITEDQWGVRDAVEAVRLALKGEGDMEAAWNAVETAEAETPGWLKAWAVAWWARSSASWAANPQEVAWNAWAAKAELVQSNEDADRLIFALLDRIEAATSASR